MNPIHCVLTALVGTTLLAGTSFAQDYDHFVRHGGTAFLPAVLLAERGDVIWWGIGAPGGTPRTITSGENCVPDGLFDGEVPPGVFEWQVPLDIAVTEIPYFNAYVCETGTPGLIRIIDIRRVPTEYSTIQEALDAADPYDMILIDAGTYYETDLTPSGDNLIIQGELDADGNHAVLIGPGPDTQSSGSIMSISGLDGLQIEGIHFAGSGLADADVTASMDIVDSSLVIENCLFTDSSGGGVVGWSATLTINDCTFRNNESAQGGGAFFGTSEATLDGCLFENNQAQGSGGAMAMKSSNVSISDCQFEGNSAGDAGAGMIADAGSLEIVDCLIRDNTAAVQAGGLLLVEMETVTSIGDTRICGNTPDQILGDWADAGGTVVQDDCSVLRVPGDFPTIELAVEAARDGDTIMIAAGNYPAGEDGFYLIEDTVVSFIGETNADGTPAVILGGALGFNGQGTSSIIVQDMQMDSLALYDCTADVTNCFMVDGNDNFAGLIINQAQGTVRNCRIANGSSGFLPGGVFISDQIAGSDIVTCDFDFIDCVIENNTGGCPVLGCSGTAGVRIEDGIVDFVRCIIRDNLASGFAGLSMASATTVSLTDTTVCGNSSSGQIVGDWTDNGGNYVADECPPDCPADLNGDGIVNGADLTILLSEWGQSGVPGDIDGSGAVDGADLTILLGEWGDC